MITLLVDPVIFTFWVDDDDSTMMVRMITMIMVLMMTLLVDPVVTRRTGGASSHDMHSALCPTTCQDGEDGGDDGNDDADDDFVMLVDPVDMHTAQRPLSHHMSRW